VTFDLFVGRLKQTRQRIVYVIEGRRVPADQALLRSKVIDGINRRWDVDKETSCAHTPRFIHFFMSSQPLTQYVGLSDVMNFHTCQSKAGKSVNSINAIRLLRNIETIKPIFHFDTVIQRYPASETGSRTGISQAQTYRSERRSNSSHVLSPFSPAHTQSYISRFVLIYKMLINVRNINATNQYVVYGGLCYA